MYVSVCIVGLGIIITTSWYQFLSEVARRCENKRRLEALAETTDSDYENHAA